MDIKLDKLLKNEDELFQRIFISIAEGAALVKIRELKNEKYD